MTPITIEVEVNAHADHVDELLRHIAKQEERFYVTAPGLGALGEIEIVAARRAMKWQSLKRLVATKLQHRREALDAAVAFMKRRLDEADALGLTGYDEHRAAVEILEDIQEWMDALEINEVLDPLYPDGRDQ